MKTIKEFFIPSDLSKRAQRYHTTFLSMSFVPTIVYSITFIYFYSINAYKFLPVVGIAILLYVADTIVCNYRKYAIAGLLAVSTGIFVNYYLTFQLGWQLGFQFHLLPPIFAAGGIFRGHNNAKFAIGLIGAVSLTLLGYLTYDHLPIYQLPEGHGIFVLMFNLVTPIWGPVIPLISSQIYAEIIENQLEASYQENENLLHSIFPKEVAEELRKTGSVKPLRFEEVTIMFSDFEGFTNIVASIPTTKLIEELNEIFSEFDDIIESEGIEKIQTVGDGYLSACGLPNPVSDHAQRCVRAGKKIIDYLTKRNETSAIKWKVRIGIHSGPVSAGVIGKKKFAYDIFGDTINTASRIESNGEAGRINVSAYTYDLIKEEFPSEYRGKLNAKGKGELDMYFVN